MGMSIENKSFYVKETLHTAYFFSLAEEDSLTIKEQRKETCKE